MRVRDVMTEGVQNVPPTMSAGQAWEIMRQQGIRHLVVVSGHDVIGVLSQRDAGGRSVGSVRIGSVGLSPIS